ncbi:hypothetical protein FQN60_017502, partial [Etheostoma spectabile]
MENEDWIMCETLHTVSDLNDFIELYNVEQEQIQKKTFTNWVNAQLAKRRPPCMVLDLFNDFRDGSKLLDLLEVMSGQRLSRERGRGMFQHRSNIEKALSFLKQKSIKLVNIHIPDIIDGKPSIILGLIWTIILQYHIEELASSLSFSSRQSSMESLATLDSRSTLSSRSASSSPVPPRGSPLHNRFRVSARKALLLWVREQCHKAGCSINVKDFKASWRSGVVFLAIQYALRPDLVDLSKARTRSNKQNLEEAFHIAEKELRIPRLLDPDDVDVRDPDEKSIMTYVAQFLQYSKDLPVPEEEMQTPYLTLPKSPSPINLPVHYTPAISASPLRQATPNQKAQEVTCWLVQAYEELLEGWDSTEGESYSERYHVFQTFLVSFNEQRRPIMPLLTAMRRTSKLSEEQQSLREAWDTLTDKRVCLPYMSLPAPLDSVARWLLKTEKALAEEEGESQDHCRAADDAREKQELLRSFQNLDEYGNLMVPTDKMEELKRRFTNVRVTVKYHGIKLEYWEHKHTVLDLLGQIRTKLQLWKRAYISPEAVRVLLQEWHDVVNTQELPSLLEAALHKLKQVSEKYSRKSALAADYHQVIQQVKQLEEDTTQVLEEMTTAKSTMGRVLSAWDSYSDVTSESMAEWGSKLAHLNEVGNFLMEAADPQTSRSLAEELHRLNMHWAEFNKRNTFDSTAEPSADIQTRPQDIKALIREVTLILKEPLETMAGPLRTYRKRIQLLMRTIKEVDLEALAPSQECPADQLQKLKLAIPEVMQTLFEAEHVCTELQHSVSGLDSRLAELLHWETEARELYQLLRATERHKQRGQDPRARVLISRGLQLEGQVVTEEQDLQVMVMTTQKNSPIQYLHASAMQDRVRATVAQSQEAVGMLSSLGARRDRSRSPPEGSPPSKVYKQAEEKPQHLRQSDTLSWLTQQSKTKLVSHHETFVPKIVVQEHREEKMTSPPLPYTYAQAVMQTRTKLQPEGQAQAWPETQKQQTQKQELIQQQQLLQQKQLKRQPEKELQQQKLKQQQPQDVQQQGVMQTQPQQLQQKQNQQQVEQHVEMHQHQVQEHVVSDRQTSEPHKQTLLQQPPVKKPHLSSQELQSRKTQAMKNRPWLQNPKTPAPEQDSTQEPIQTRQTQPRSDRETAASVQVVPQHTASARPQPEAHAKDTKQPQKQQKEQQKETQQSQTLKLQQQEHLQHQQQQQKEKHQQQHPQQLEKTQKQQEQLLQQQQQEKQPQPIVTPAKPDTDTKAKSLTVTMAQPHPQTKAQNQTQPQTMVQSKSQAAVHVQSTDGQQPLKTMSQNRVCHIQSQTKVFSQPHGPIKTQSLTQPQLQLQSQVQTQSRTCVPAGPQPSMQPQGLALSPAVTQMQTWAQVRPSSPRQAPLQGQIQPPVPSHIQLCSHPQSWAPVRPPSPKPPTHTHIQTHAQSMAQSQTQPQPMAHPQTHAHSMAQVQTHPQPMAHPQTHTQSMAQVQIHAQPMARPNHAQPSTQNQTQAQLVVQPQGHSQPMTQYATHAQPEVQHPGHISQGQIHSWSQDSVSSPMSVQPPQATAQPSLYPQGYSQGQSSSQPWTLKQEPQNQAISQQMHPITQPYPQQICQAPQSQAYPTLQALPQWPQVGPQQGPQVGPPIRNKAKFSNKLGFKLSLIFSPSRMHSLSLSNIHTFSISIKLNITHSCSCKLKYLPNCNHHTKPILRFLHSLSCRTSPKHASRPSHGYKESPRPRLGSLSSIFSCSSHYHNPNIRPSSSHNQVFSHQLNQKPMAQSKRKAELPPQPKPQAKTAALLEAQSPTLHKVQSSTQPEAQSPPQPKPEAQPARLLKAPSPTQPKAQALPQPKPQAQLPPHPQLQAQSPTLPKAQTAPESKAQSPPQARPQLPQSKPQTQSPPQPKPQQSQTILLCQVNVLPQSLAESPDLCIKPLALAQVPPQTYTEAYSKAQALARNGFEEAKHCLQEHILETINIFKDKSISAEQASVKEETLKTLDPELLEEFLRAAKGMEAFCTPLQLQDMELFTQSVRTQWEAVRAEISGFLKHLRFEVTRKDFNKAAQQCEMHLSSRLKKKFQACFSAEGSFAQAGQHLEALKELCDTLSPEDAHRLAQTQLRECEKRLAAIQRQFSGDQDTPLSDSRIPVAFSEDLTTQNESARPSDKPHVSSEETESLWSEYANQCSQLSGNTGLEEGKAKLQEQWRSQQSKLQRMGSSLGAALRQIDSTENHMVDFTDRLDRYLRQPKDITAFTLANTNILKDIKELDDNIQCELDQLSRLDPDSSDLDPRDCFPLSREVETHRNSLDQLRQQVRKSEAAARALDRFLMSLRTVDEDISGVQGAPCSDTVILQDCRSKLALIQQSIDSLKEKAPQLDVLLQGARLTVTRDGVPASCLDMVTALLRRLEEADSRLASQQKSLQKETQSKSLGLRKRTLLGELRKLQDTIEKQGVKEPTMHAVQHSLRALSDLEGQLQAQHAELQNLLELQEKQGGGEHLLQELETQWKDTQTAFFDRKKQWSLLLELLKKFQSCRSHLSNTMQKAEQSISDQASYLGKGNLQRSITTVTEKTDAYLDNLRVGVELWDKQLMLGGEVDRWAGSKLALFAESHPFHSKQQVLDMRDEIHVNEENIEHFHKKSAEIQEMLQSREAPLELQVMETQLRKRMEQVKELFADCTDVFEELMAVKKHLAEKIEQCQSAVERIQSSVSNVDALQPKVEDQLQHLCDKLEAQEQQAEAAIKEVGLVSSVASPQVLEVLSVDCSRLKESISRTQAMIQLKREEKDKGLLNVIKDARQSFEYWFQDLQLSINECFEHPESRADVETSLQRLTVFLKSKDAEIRLEQIKVQLERGSQQVPLQQLSEFTDWLKEQQKEVATLKKQHDSFRDWLQNKEKQPVEVDKVKLLLKNLQDESGRAESLSELLASVRRQGVRAESLLKDGDNLIQRYRNLESRLQRQADAQSALEAECDKFNTQAQSTRTWITALLQPLTPSGREAETQERKHRAQAILSSKTQGDSKMNALRRQSESLCEREDLQDDRKQEVQQLLRETEKQWNTVLHTAEENLSQAQTQALLGKDLDAFKTQNENVESWIRDREQSMQLLTGCMQAILSSKPDGESKLQCLKQQFQSLCDSQGLDQGSRREVQDAVRQTEEQWRKVFQAAEDGLNKAQTDAATEKDFDAFKSKSESIQCWIKEQKQKLLSLGSHMPFEERLQVAQAVMTSKLEILELQTHGERLREHLEESRKPEVQQLVEDTEQQWRGLQQAARQAELRSLSDDFDTQNKNTQSWIRDRQQQLQAVGSHTPPDQRCHAAQDADQGRKAHVQKAIRDMEEQWKTILQAAKQVEAAAAAEIAQQTEMRAAELKEFDSQQQDTDSWLTDLQQQLDSLKSLTKAKDRLLAAQAIVSSKPEGDSRLQELRRRCQSLCGQNLGETKNQKVQQKVRGAEEQWTRVLQNAKQVLDQAEKRFALEGKLTEYEALKTNTRAWLEDKQRSLVSLDIQTDLEKTINTAQTVLSCKPEGDSRMTELRRQSQILSDLDESTRLEVQQTVKDSEEQWRTVLQTAENCLEKANIHYLLSRELDGFQTKAGRTQTWGILSSKSNGEAQLMELKRRAQSLCEHKDLQGDKKFVLAAKVDSAKSTYNAKLIGILLYIARKTILKFWLSKNTTALDDWKLKGVVERLLSCDYQRGLTEERLSKLQKQISSLPRVFPWPGLGERRQAVEQARTMLDQCTALAPVLSDLRTQAAELFEITREHGWSELSWAAKQESIPTLLKELTDAVAQLEQGILVERHCTQLVEQHEAAQDWLREHVKGLGVPPADRQGLHSAALLQTVDREQREMKELDSASDSLLGLCTPGGRDALTLEVSHLHELCTTSEQEVRERLASCETRLEELDHQLAKRAKGLKERSAALQWELRSLDQALSYSQPQNNIPQLQQHWHSLQNCEKSLADLGVKVQDLQQEVKATPVTDELPTEIMTLVKSLCQQHDSLKSRLSEHQGTCSTNTARCLMDCIHALQEWNHRKPESISSAQVILEEGEKLETSLREALSHQQFLTDCLIPVLIGKLEREGSETLREADTQKAYLSCSLKELDGKSKQKLPQGNFEETKTSVVPPPRKSKHSSEKNPQFKLQKSISLTEKSTSIDDNLSVLSELQTEDKTLKPTVTAVMKDIQMAGVEQTRSEPTKQKSQSPTYTSEPFKAQRNNTSQEAAFKGLKSDTTAVGAKQIKPAVEEPVLIPKVIEQSASGVSENTTPVPSRRKSKTLTTDTQPAHTKVEPEMIKPIITQGLPRNPTGPAAVEETKHIATIILDETTKTKTKMPGSQISLLRSKEETDAAAVVKKETVVIPTRRKSKILDDSADSEPVADNERATCVVQESEKSTSQFVSAPAETAVLEQSTILPQKQKSTTLPLKQADQQPAKMTGELESQRPALSFREENSKSTELTTSQHVVAHNRTTDLKADDNKPDSLKSSSLQMGTETTETTVVK